MTKSWKDNLQKASFRGVSFFVKSHSAEFGRRVVSYDFPYGDKPFTDDLGKKSRTYRIEGFLLSQNYFVQRDKIVSACEQMGSGILVHPYLGRMHVNCTALSLSEDLDAGGVAHLSFHFVESGDEILSVVEADKAANVSQSTEDLRTKVFDFFKKNYDVINITKSGIQRVQDFVDQVMDKINEAQKNCVDAAQISNDLVYLTKNIKYDLHKTISQPDQMASLFQTSYGTLSKLIDGIQNKDGSLFITANDRKRLQSWKMLSNQNINQVQILKSTSRESQIESKNKCVIEVTCRSLALSYLADCSSNAQFDSTNQAENARQIVMDAADDILDYPIISDDLFSSIQKMKISVCQAIGAIENKLPLISEINVTKNTNTLLFLYEKFGKLEKEIDLIQRNNITDPFDIKIGTTLQVIV